MYDHSSKLFGQYGCDVTSVQVDHELWPWNLHDGYVCGPNADLTGDPQLEVALQ